MFAHVWRATVPGNVGAHRPSNPSFPASFPVVPNLCMDSSGSLGNAVKKQEDDGRDDKRDVKPIPKTLNRVPRTSFGCWRAVILIFCCRSMCESPFAPTVSVRVSMSVPGPLERLSEAKDEMRGR